MSLLKSYKESGLLFNLNFLEETSQSGTFAYRGELVLIEGEIADAKGHVKPPVEVMRGVVLIGDDKLELVIGAIDQAEFINTFVDKYKSDFSENMIGVLFIVNIDKPVQVQIEGINFVLIPLVQGVPWNEILDELGLEKSDFKGQTSANKVMTVLDEIKTYKPKYPLLELDDILEDVTDTVRETWGAI
ncbi:MAG: hypothetical protein KZQ67_17125 [gamma proteobacterium symbiont of Bathyaustriella thionipta]|nr:hypothetical protein [gamma proteobacterium symbiont of Bathyaustriella thionipta]MCU7951701.1 hypothetical protein [gamma proteobacterium symbiont of Bathyaustriella thionipta]MCU7958302.1 hypothetical protein [gamma proteobacterium symbiont of Bathyaustriella thionipta]